MIPDSLKLRYHNQVRPQFDRASGELRQVLQDLGVSVNKESSLKEVIARIRAKNPTFRDLGLNLDMATYDLRKKLWWDANMLTAYAQLKADTTFETKIVPKVSQAKKQAESGARKLFEQLRELTSRKSVEADVSSEQ